MTDLDPLTDPALRDWVEAHRVCWEATEHRELTPGGVHAIGYDIVLMAQCAGPGPCDPGGAGSVEIYERLAEIAKRVSAADARESVSLRPFQASFHLRRETQWAPEVQLVMEIRHRHADYFGPLDAGEKSCLSRIEGSLTALGVQRDAWKNKAPARTAGEGLSDAA